MEVKMGIVIENALVVLPEGSEDVIQETSLYIEGDKIAGIEIGRAHV